MKNLLHTLAASAAVAVAAILVLNPHNGAAFTGPYATVGLGMIGLGLMQAMRKKHAPRPVSQPKPAN
ncbi:MAG: hypothetical protein GC164_04700 [Phycisphaera sp.]|nr:hypothetical protein [Phycisphaera sp.]